MAQLSKVLKVVCWAGSVPFPPSVPAEAGCLFTVAAGVHVFISGESLHCFLVGWCTNKSYVIATSDLWLFIHASNLLLSTPHTHSPTIIIIRDISMAAYSLARSWAQCAVKKAAEKCIKTYNGRNKNGFGSYDHQPRKNLHRAISVNKPKLLVTKHDQTVLSTHV